MPSATSKNAMLCVILPCITLRMQANIRDSRIGMTDST
jgi:hypothetical protein